MEEQGSRNINNMQLMQSPRLRFWGALQGGKQNDKQGLLNIVFLGL